MPERVAPGTYGTTAPHGRDGPAPDVKRAVALAVGLAYTDRPASETAGELARAADPLVLAAASLQLATAELVDPRTTARARLLLELAQEPFVRGQAGLDGG
jgi:hypothetical protein